VGQLFGEILHGRFGHPILLLVLDDRSSRLAAASGYAHLLFCHFPQGDNFSTVSWLIFNCISIGLVDSLRAPGAKKRREQFQRLQDEGHQDGLDLGAGFHWVQGSFHGAHLRQKWNAAQFLMSKSGKYTI